MAKFKNPFKKKSLTDTLMNVVIGGAANVTIDYVWEQVDALQPYDEYKHIAKIVGGALAGSMVSAPWARAAADGIATVGVSNLIAGYLEKDGKDKDPDPDPSKGPGGLPGGTIGALRGYRYGKSSFGKGKGRMAGLEDFQTT